MNLSQLQLIAQANNNQAEACCRGLGVLGTYAQQLHVNLLPEDFEQIMDEKVPDKQWATPGGNEHTTFRFAMYRGQKNQVIISTKFDSLA